MKAEDWKAIDNGSKVMGRFKLHLDSGMIINGATLVDGKNGPFVSLPQRQWEGRDGKPKWDPIIEFSSKERREQFDAAALRAVNALRQGQA